MPRITPIVRQLLLINFGLFLLQRLLGVDLVNGLGLRYLAASSFRPYQFFTHLFVHASLVHLLGNMVSLLTFGPTLEHTLTSRCFIVFYIFTGIGAAVLYAGVQYYEIGRFEAMYYAYLGCPSPSGFTEILKHFPQETYNSLHSFLAAFFEYPDNSAYIAKSKAIASQLHMLRTNIPTVGASGAVFGMLMAFSQLFPNTRLCLNFFPVPIKAKYLVVAYGAYELYAGLRANPADNVAHFAHLGGVLFAYLFINWWKRRVAP